MLPPRAGGADEALEAGGGMYAPQAVNGVCPAQANLHAPRRDGLDWQPLSRGQVSPAQPQ
jgi:hypothetical protein